MREKENRAMHLFVLGIVLGAGLVLAYQEIQLQVLMYKQDKLKAAQDKAIALLAECTCWDTNGEHAYYCQINESAK
jgi:hypothetical protein